MDYNFGSLHGAAGPTEVTGGLLLILGLFTGTTAFILCGEMAVGVLSPVGLRAVSGRLATVEKRP